ncbi:MAG: arginine decarboxylase, pyruvoyl-dependent [Candidatus Aminicenantales bacterium]
MSAIIPQRLFLTKGRGQHKEKLASLEQALRDAGIAPFNLVKVSSIFPPSCKLVSREEGLKVLRPGQIIFLVMSENSTNEAHRLISASIGLAIPNTPVHYGYLSEHHSFGQNEKEAGLYAEQLAAEMLATTLGQNFDISEIWEGEEKKVFKISDELLVRTRNITQTTKGEKGLWTTALAAAVFVP